MRTTGAVMLDIEKLMNKLSKLEKEIEEINLAHWEN